MHQKNLFETDYDIEQVTTSLVLLSDLRDINHATSQGLLAVIGAMSKLDSVPIDFADIYDIVRDLYTLNEKVSESAMEIIEKGAYRGEK